MKKGLSLPIEMIVIVAIAVLVLVVIAAFFTGGFMPTGDKIAIQNAFTQGCNYVRSVKNCVFEDFNINVQLAGDSGPQPTSFSNICAAQLGRGTINKATRTAGSNFVTPDDCLVACGCPGVENQPQPVGT